MTGFKSKRAAALDEEGMYLVHQTDHSDDNLHMVAQPAQEPVGGCACRWDSEGDRVVTCDRHEGWLEVIAEWADRARDAEKKLKAPAQPVQEPHNFCPRCGKRAPDPTTIHTCTPPKGGC